ncbi:MAG: bifunctional trypsin-like peptidase domain-containing/SEL1-like repeat protein [Lysobacterales bacterium]
MNRITVLSLGMIFGVFGCAATGSAADQDVAADGATAASRVFATASPSIVVVEALDAQQKPVAFGSGVVIAKGVVVSNCHVFTYKDTDSAIVVYRQQRFTAVLRYGDLKGDLCSFAVDGLEAPAATIGSTATLAVGDKVYAIGTPEGYDLTLSDGLVSSLRKIPDGVAIQTTAPISPGSSGGGLFDGQGRLIGITSYQVTAGQQLNFALPVEWVEALPQRGKTAQELAAEAAANPAPGTVAKAEGAPPPGNGNRRPPSNDGATKSPQGTSDLAHTEALAKQGDAEAQYHLGLIYQFGKGVPPDLVKAAYWYDKAAEQGDALAQTVLGVMYDLGEGVLQDHAKAAYWYGKAAAQGDAKAQNFLGGMYGNGNGVPRDDAKALYWYAKAAEQGDASAQFHLGNMYFDGRGVPQNYAKAIFWYGKAAEQGHAIAQFNLGIMYGNGRGVPQNYAKAFYWYGKAAEQGDASAQFNLGIMYDHGMGVPQDHSKAIYWYGKAAEQGHTKAQFNLGVTYFNGEGTPQDYVQAAKWFILAKANGTEGADEALSRTERKMTPQQIAEAQRLAAQWWAAHPRAAAPTSAATVAPASATVTVTSVVLGNAVGPDQKVTEPTTSFSPRDMVYAAVSTAGAAPSATLAARWTYQDGQTVNESNEVIAPNGAATTTFHISKPDGWPRGNYEVEIFLDGRAVATKIFSVR